MTAATAAPAANNQPSNNQQPQPYERNITLGTFAELKNNYDIHSHFASPFALLRRTRARLFALRYVFAYYSEALTKIIP